MSLKINGEKCINSHTIKFSYLLPYEIIEKTYYEKFGFQSLYFFELGYTNEMALFYLKNYPDEITMLSEGRIDILLRTPDHILQHLLNTYHEGVSYLYLIQNFLISLNKNEKIDEIDKKSVLDGEFLWYIMQHIINQNKNNKI